MSNDEDEKQEYDPNHRLQPQVEALGHYASEAARLKKAYLDRLDAGLGAVLKRLFNFSKPEDEAICFEFLKAVIIQGDIDRPHFGDNEPNLEAALADGDLSPQQDARVRAQLRMSGWYNCVPTEADFADAKELLGLAGLSYIGTAEQLCTALAQYKKEADNTYTADRRTQQNTLDRKISDWSVIIGLQDSKKRKTAKEMYDGILAMGRAMGLNMAKLTSRLIDIGCEAQRQKKIREQQKRAGL